MPLAADFVIKVMLDNYPDLNIPYHSRSRHLEVAGIDRIDLIMKKTVDIDRIKSVIEIVILSSLLDAGAGMQWSYKDHLSNSTLSKSEGLAVAVFNLYVQGIFSSNSNYPNQVDPLGLQHITESVLADGFQVSNKNPLIGLNGRLGVLVALGSCIENKPEYFNSESSISSDLRLGNILDYWINKSRENTLSMNIVFTSLLDALSDIWPGRYILDGINLGDVWQHSLSISMLNFEGYTPFHKLTQWVCYSLIEPLQEAGLKVTDINMLTGLPEYRNGGLFVDLKVLQPKKISDWYLKHKIDSEFIVEWRAMTVALLDNLAGIIRAKLNLTEDQLALSQILQGGTWAAGRIIAAQLRTDGGPPFKLDSDGTVF